LETRLVDRFPLANICEGILKKQLVAPSESELFGVLRDVSRSFYISVRFLPKRIRLTIALAYLLARASDTIADTNGMAPQSRIEFLAQFLTQICKTTSHAALDATPFLGEQAEAPEKTLLLNIKRILRSLAMIPPRHRELVAEVLSKIIRGQTLDIERFELRPGLHRLPDDSSLEEYTYLVAGSVGEFWTKICLLEWGDYSHLPATKLLGLGREFGQGLQLINILRDFPSDLRQGRCYLPIANLNEVVVDPNPARAEWERWRQRALAYLGAGWEYLNAIRPPRVRFACAVPLFIGIRTLKLLGKGLELRPGIKIPRSEVKSLVCWAVALAWLPFLKGYIDRRIFRSASLR
jgi:farnesyl-diphosphate farnesyltransferase